MSSEANSPAGTGSGSNYGYTQAPSAMNSPGGTGSGSPSAPFGPQTDCYCACDAPVPFDAEPTGNALVLEGGGYRGVFTAGVLDVLQEHGVYGFDSVWGVSAGAINASNFKSRQIGRNFRIMLAYRDDKRFMSLWSLATTGNMAGSEFMYDEIQNRLDPCDNQTFNKNPLRMYVVATDVVFGTAAYLPCTRFPEDVVNVQASASMPLVSKVVEVDGRRLLDGGTADSIPYEVALGLEGASQVEGHKPAERALVVLTQDRSFVRKPANELMAIRSHRYDGFPYYIESLATRYERYNACRERLFDLERQDEPRVLVIAPEKPVTVSTSGAAGGELLDLYLQGRRQAEARLAEIDAFLNGE